jgi:hypothetical protein
MPMKNIGSGFWEKYGGRIVAYCVVAGLLIVIFFCGIGSCATMVKNTDVAIIVNNITGGKSILENGGMVIHLPFGLSSVYSIDKSQRVLYLTHAHKT